MKACLLIWLLIEGPYYTSGTLFDCDAVAEMANVRTDSTYAYSSTVAIKGSMLY